MSIEKSNRKIQTPAWSSNGLYYWRAIQPLAVTYIVSSGVWTSQLLKLSAFSEPTAVNPCIWWHWLTKLEEAGRSSAACQSYRSSGFEVHLSHSPHMPAPTAMSAAPTTRRSESPSELFSDLSSPIEVVYRDCLLLWLELLLLAAPLLVVLRGAEYEESELSDEHLIRTEIWVVGSNFLLFDAYCVANFWPVSILAPETTSRPTARWEVIPLLNERSD